jgi:hypothetical protein
MIVLYHVGVENNPKGRSMAWVLGHPGCFAYGKDSDIALSATPNAIQEYWAWISARGEESWAPPGDADIQLDETWEIYRINENFELSPQGYEVDAWFQNDWKPLTDEDVQRGLKLITWSREDLLQTVSDLGAEELECEYPDERWNITGILKHVGGAEWWYMDRLGLAFAWEQVPKTPFDRLEVVRERLVEVLPNLIGSHQVLGMDGEFWSPRKMLRRAVWHERDHTTHISKLISA